MKKASVAIAVSVLGVGALALVVLLMFPANKEVDARHKALDQEILSARKALAAVEKRAGREDPAVALALVHLGKLHHDRGTFGEAEASYLRASAIREKSLGKEHQASIEVLNALAELYQFHLEGRRSQAEALYRQAIALNEKALGADHPRVAESIGSLASFYDHVGNDAQAELLYARALAIRAKAFGQSDPAVALSSTALAGVYLRRRDYAKAEPLYQRSLAILADSPQAAPAAAFNLERLAELYRATGRIEAAEDMEKRAAAMRK